MNGAVRSIVSEPVRRKAYLKHVYEVGFGDGFKHDQPTTKQNRYLEDAAALKEYRIGLRIGRRERARGMHGIGS